MSEPREAMESEFDVVAGWTQDAVRELGADYAIAAGCRGSGSPSSLRWLADALEVPRARRMLDSGAGVGGPAAWVEQTYGLRPVCAEPMPDAVQASRRLFGLPSVVAWSQALPFSRGAFDVAWCLGVLSTTQDKAGVLGELRRVLSGDGRLGLLAFVADGALTEPVPEGNSFPSEHELRELLAAAGFTVAATADPGALPETPPEWQRRADRVEAVLADRHESDSRWLQAQEQSARMGALLDGGGLRAVLVHAVCR